MLPQMIPPYMKKELRNVFTWYTTNATEICHMVHAYVTENALTYVTLEH